MERQAREQVRSVVAARVGLLLDKGAAAGPGLDGEVEKVAGQEGGEAVELWLRGSSRCVMQSAGGDGGGEEGDGAVGRDVGRGTDGVDGLEVVGSESEEPGGEHDDSAGHGGGGVAIVLVGEGDSTGDYGDTGDEGDELAGEVDGPGAIKVVFCAAREQLVDTENIGDRGECCW